MPDRWSSVAAAARTMTSSGATAAAAAAATTQRFDRHVSNATCRLVDINEHLLCALCSGYLVDATTIIECLHTFCRSCIVRYLESSETCPVCDVPLHQTNPLLGIRADTTLQTLVYKLVPGVFKDEVKRRCSVISNAHADGKSSVMERLLKDICDMTTGGTIYTADEQFSVCLQYAPSSSYISSSSASDARHREPCSRSSCAKSQQDLTKCSYLLCPSSVTVAHLKKLIRNKLELGSELPLDLYHSSPDGSLDDVYTLADVAYITAWTSVKPLHFYYQVNTKPSQKSTSKTANGSEETGCKRKVAHGTRSEKLPGGACLKGVIASNRRKMKVKGVVFTSMHSKTPKAAVKKVKSLAGKYLKGSSPQSFMSVEKSSTNGETGRGDETSYSKNHCRQKDDCDSQDDDLAKASLEEQDRGKSLADDTAKEKDKMQTKSSDRNSIELTELEVPDVVEISLRTSSRSVNSGTPKPSPPRMNRMKSGLAECSPSADSALSPSRPETVTQSAMTVDGFDTMSDADGNVIDSASSPPPAKRAKLAEPNDRNLFAAFKSMMVNNNDNVVSSSTSSQASADDSGDNKTSVETQTSAKLISRRSRKGKLRIKKDPIIKSRPLKQVEGSDDANADTALPPSAGASVIAVSARTSGQSVSVAERTSSYSADVDTTTQCASATLCVPICIGDKTGGGSNLILNLPQNVSVQCRIRSDKILIASSPTTATAANTEIVSATFNSIACSQTTTITTDTNNVSTSATSLPSPSITSHVSPNVLTSQALPCLTSHSPPNVTSQALLNVKSPVFTSSGPRSGTSITQACVTSLTAPCITTSVPSSPKSHEMSVDNSITSPLPRKLDRRTIPENKGHVCNNGMTSPGDYESPGKEVPLKSEAIRRTVNLSDSSTRFKDKFQGSAEEVPTRPKPPGNSEKRSPVTRVSCPVKHEIPTRLSEVVLSDSSALDKPRCESNVSAVAAKPTCFKKAPGQEATGIDLQYGGVSTEVTIRDKESDKLAATLQQNSIPVATNACKTISRPKEVVLPAIPVVVSTTFATAAASSAASTTKAVLFKPYQIATTACHVTSPNRSPEGITATATFQGATHHNVLYSKPAFPVFPNFQYPKNQPVLSHQGDVSKAYRCVLTDSVLASSASCEMTKPGMIAVHRTMNNIPLHNVIKVPTYTARKMPLDKRSEKKGLRTPQSESSTSPAAVSTPRKLESCLGSQDALGLKTVKADKLEGKLPSHTVSGFMREMPVSKGRSFDQEVALQTTKGTTDDLSHGKGDEGGNQLRIGSGRSYLKQPLGSADILDRGDASPCATSTSSNEQAALTTCELETGQKTTPTRKRFDFHGSSGSDRRHSPKERSEKTCPLDEMSYTCAEADSGTSPGAVSLSPPRSGSKHEAPPRVLSPNLQELSAPSGNSLRKKLVIDLERCSPRQSKQSGANYVPNTPVSTSVDQRLHCCSPTTTTIPAVDPPRSGQATPPRLVISLPRCQVPAPTTFLSPSGCMSQWSPTSSSADNSPPTTKRLKLMCNGMTIYRTLESPGSRSPRRASGGGGSGGGGRRKSSPVSAPAVADCPSSLLSRASSCKSPSSPQGKCRRKSNGSAPVVPGGAELKSVLVAGGAPPVGVVNVDSTSSSPRDAATSVSLSNNNGLLTVMTPWRAVERSVSLPETLEEQPLELTTKEVKERQKEREYAKLISNLRPPSAFTT